MKKAKGYLLLLLHAHLPYIRHPEHDYFLEENWLYEAITESYIPLLDIFDSLLNDSVEFKIALSISPTLAEMFNDPLLRKRCLRYMNNLIELSEKEILRTRRDHSLGPLAKMNNSRFKRIRSLYENIYKKDLTSALGRLKDTGKVEILTTAATHAYLPAFDIIPSAVNAQIKVAIMNHLKNFGEKPKGMWLPECGYFSDLDEILKEAGIKFFFIDAHGLLNGSPTPRYGTYAPVACPSGVIAFGRDMNASKQVWSSIEGYPGDFDYRDFYRDAGFDLPMDYIEIYTNGIRTYTGIKYYSVTGKTENKKPYNREKAINKAKEHAEDFISVMERQMEFLSNTVGFTPLVTAPYDAELLGHWWHEGPDWLNFLLRKIVLRQNNLRTITPSEYLNKNSGRRLDSPSFQRISPSMSSWGYKGYNDVWLNDSNNWIYRHLHGSAEKMTELANEFPQAEGLLKRTLNQAAREILLSQHSDWAFILKTGSASAYAVKRISEHMERFNSLYAAARSGRINEEWLCEIEDKDRIFPEIDYLVYSDHESSLSKG